MTSDELQNWEGKRGVLVATHPRSGTHLTMDLLRRNFRALRSHKPPFVTLDYLYVPIDVFVLDGIGDAKLRAVARNIRRLKYPVLKSHWLDPDLTNLRRCQPSLADWVDSHTRKIYVTRAPCAVMASTCAFEEGFRSTMNADERAKWLQSKADYWIAHVTEWLARPDVLHIRFEDLVRSPESTLNRIATHLGETPEFASPILPPRLKSKWHARCARLFRNSPSTEILVPGAKQAFDQMFDQHAAAAFRKSVQPLSERLGYA